MLTFITVLTSLVGLLLVAVILIQNPKGGGVDSTYGGQATTQMFGAARSTDFIEKLTWYLVIALFVMCVAASFFLKSAGASTQLLSQ